MLIFNIQINIRVLSQISHVKWSKTKIFEKVITAKGLPETVSTFGVN